MTCRSLSSGPDVSSRCAQTLVILLAAVAARGVRKTVTVVFCDSELQQCLGPGPILFRGALAHYFGGRGLPRNESTLTVTSHRLSPLARNALTSLGLVGALKVTFTFLP